MGLELLFNAMSWIRGSLLKTGIPCVNAGVRCCVYVLGWMSDLPAVEFKPQAQLFVVNDHVSSHVLLCPDTVGQSLLQPGEADKRRKVQSQMTNYFQMQQQKFYTKTSVLCVLTFSLSGTNFLESHLVAWQPHSGENSPGGDCAWRGNSLVFTKDHQN